ncbi:MAG: hypothetical protein GY679_00105 [Mycoplasma sp.]|nr:hypothetical protein [Mycoplasma sp.]
MNLDLGMLKILKKLYNRFFKGKEKTITLSDITVFDFKNCSQGDLSSLNNDADKWSKLDELWQDTINSKGIDLILELRTQIAIKENTVIILDSYLFMMRNAFKSYQNSLITTPKGISNDVYYLDIIDFCADELIKHGIKYNKMNNLIKEHNRCIKLVRNKRNDIQVDINDLKEATKGENVTFDDLIAVVGKFSGGGLIRQKTTTVDEFVSFYKLMVKYGSWYKNNSR